jgi:cytosine/adenosine deaminase-related metal-dependent hydrolase
MTERLISAAWVLPITQPPIGDGAVVVDETDAIRAVGRRGDLRRLHPRAVEERAAGALLPGLVNAHCHLELSALAGAVGGGAGLVAWAAQLMSRAPAKTTAAATTTTATTTATAATATTTTKAATATTTTKAATAPARVAQAAAEAAAEAVRFGTAAMGDVGNSLAAVPALGAAGLRGMFFHELVGSREARDGGALADAARELEAFPSDGWPRGLGYVPAPHAPYSVGPDLMRKIFVFAARAALPTSVHVAEDGDELALLRDGGGRWPAVLRGLGVDPATRAPRLAPVAYLASLGAFNAPAPPLLVHMVHAGAEDRRLAREAGATAVLCPRSNLHIGGRLPDLPALLGDGVALAIGTDSLASTDDLSLWGEIATLRVRFPAVPAALWLDAATRGGAEAMRLGACGALVPGGRPGIIEVAHDDEAAPLEALVRDPRPAVTWRARA